MNQRCTRLPTALSVAVAALWLSAPGTAAAQSEASAPSPGVSAAAAAPNPEYLLIMAPARQVHADLTFEVDAPRFSVQEWIVYGAELPMLPGQTGVSSTLEPRGERGRERSAEHRPILRARIAAENPDARAKLSLHIVYQATLWSRRLERAPAAGKRPMEMRPERTVPPLDAAERRMATAVGGLFDVASDAFRRWMDEYQLSRDAGEGEIDFARRVFRAIKTGFTYTHRANMDRRASKVCRAGAGDCGALSTVFVSALRARGIPARLLVGRWAQSGVVERDGSRFEQQHVKSEFYAQGVGWVPVDVSSGLVHDRSPEGLDFFGNDPGNFLTLHVNANLVCDTILLGRKTVEWMQSPAYWATGAGTFDQSVIRERWVVKTAPAPELVEASFKQPAPRAAGSKPERKAASAPRR